MSDDEFQAMVSAYLIHTNEELARGYDRLAPENVGKHDDPITRWAAELADVVFDAFATDEDREYEAEFRPRAGMSDGEDD